MLAKHKNVVPIEQKSAPMTDALRERIIPRKCGGWLAVSNVTDPVQIGVTAATSEAASIEFRRRGSLAGDLGIGRCWSTNDNAPILRPGRKTEDDGCNAMKLMPPRRVMSADVQPAPSARAVDPRPPERACNRHGREAVGYLTTLCQHSPPGTHDVHRGTSDLPRCKSS